MKKLIILGLNKSDTRSEYKFKKQEGVIESIIELLIKLGFKDEDPQIQYAFVSSKYFPAESGNKYEKIKNIIDYSEHFENKHYDIDVIMGIKKVFLIVRANKINQQKLSKILTKIGKFIDEK